MSLSTQKVQPLPSQLVGSLAVAPVDQRWLIDGLWVEQGVGVIGGQPKSFKSWLALEMATAIAAGIPCLGLFEVRNPGPTLVYLAEDALPDVRQRLVSICKARELELDTLELHVITAPTLRLDVEDDFRRLIETIKLVKPRLLVLDPFVRLHTSDENRSNEVAAILGRLRDIQRSLEVAILVVHHARKVTAGLSPGQALRGSTDFHAWVDCLIFLQRDRQGLRLITEHRSAPAMDPLYIDLDPRTPHLFPLEPGENNASKPSLHDRVLAEIDRAQEPLTRTELRARLRVNNKRLGDTLTRLEELGHLRRTAKGWQR